jgi:hypothetical protein
VRIIIVKFNGARHVALLASLAVVAATVATVGGVSAASASPVRIPTVSSGAAVNAAPTGDTVAHGTAAAESIPILYASQGGTAHQCTVIGSAPYKGITYQGVVCADLHTGMDSNGNIWYRGEIEAYCQTSSGAEVQCANVEATGAATSTFGDWGTAQINCGHSAGQCSASRNLQWTGPSYIQGITRQNCTDSPPFTIWAIVIGSTNGGDTIIQLPGSDAYVTLTPSNANDSGNESTGHYYLCP